MMFGVRGHSMQYWRCSSSRPRATACKAEVMAETWVTMSMQ